MRFRYFVFSLLIGGGTSIAAPVGAAPITIAFDGAFVSSNASGIGVGDLFSGTFTYDTDASDSAPGDSQLGSYALVSATLTTPLGVSMVGARPAAIVVDRANGGGDHEFALLYDDPAAGMNVDLRLADTDRTVFPNDSLPAALLLAAFESARLNLDIFGDVETQATGQLRTLVHVSAVPEPGTLALVATTLPFGLRAVRARRRARDAASSGTA